MSENKEDLYQIWDDFLNEWPVGRVREMTLSDYAEAGNNNTFTRWMEGGLDKLGSIWGGSSFKFGVYSRKDEKSKEDSKKLRYNEGYAWLGKYGGTPEKAFESVRSEIITVIDAVLEGDLQAIDKVDLGDGYKWKIAFHYQNREEPLIINVFKKEALETVFGSGGKLSTLYEKAV
ncbi:MAG: hypothetical protein JKY80_04865, partial [Mariprofundaceae bacterium]|nr:hypothetical protein [Mariprofundaceae bacterium]